MYNRVLIRQEDLSDMLRTTDSRDLSDFLHLNTNFSSARKTAQVSAQGTSRNSKKYEEEIQKQIEESQSFSYNLFKQAEKIEGSTQNSECDKYKQRLISTFPDHKTIQRA